MSKNRARLLFTGDYDVTNQFSKHIRQLKNKASIFGDLLESIQTADFSITNIEYPVTSSSKQYWTVGKTIKMKPIGLTPLQEAGFTVASIGNNHTLDYGIGGLQDTLRNCKKLGLETVGAGLTYSEAREIYYRRINGITIAVLNFAENEYNVANDNHGGANPLDLIENVKDIRVAKANSDYVFVTIHGGPDFCHYPYPDLVKRCRFYAEEGASAIVCHHTHYVSGYEIHYGAPIFYSLGNFIYPVCYEPKRRNTLVIEFTLLKEELSFRILPCKFSLKDMQLKFLRTNEKESLLKSLTEINDAFNSIHILRNKWYDCVKSDEVRYLCHMLGIPSLVFLVFRKLGLLAILKSLLKTPKVKFVLINNLFRCEHHRQAILELFKEMLDGKEEDVKHVNKLLKNLYSVSREETR